MMVDREHPYSKLINEAIADFGISVLGYEENYLTVAEFMSFEQKLQAQLKPFHAEISGFRAVKEEWELELMRKAQAITDKAFAEVLPRLKVEKEYNGGMGSNGLTSARHDVFSKYLAEKYPESYDAGVPEDLVYSGGLKLTDAVEGSPIDAGKLVLSPTRTYAPVVKKLLDALRPEIHGMVHCSGGAQTKVLHFVGDNCRVIKDNLFPVPPLFKTIHEQSQTDWAEMYKVFNMGHRLEVYLSPEHAEEVIAISKSFGIDAQVVGRIEESDGKKELIIRSEFGEFTY